MKKICFEIILASLSTGQSSFLVLRLSCPCLSAGQPSFHSWDDPALPVYRTIIVSCPETILSLSICRTTIVPFLRRSCPACLQDNHRFLSWNYLVLVYLQDNHRSIPETILPCLSTGQQSFQAWDDTDLPVNRKTIIFALDDPDLLVYWTTIISVLRRS